MLLAGRGGSLVGAEVSLLTIPVGDRVAPIAPEILRRDFGAGCGLVAFVFAQCNELGDAVDEFGCVSYGMSRGVSDLDRWLLGGASVAADAYKAIGLFFVGWALKQGRFVVWSLASTAWIVCLMVGLTSAFGYAALNRSDATRRGDDRGVAYQSIKGQLDRVDRRRAMLGVVESRGVVEARGRQLKASQLWRDTRECRDVRRAEQVRYCGDVRQWQQERAASEEATRLDTEIVKLRGQFGGFVTTSVVGDPLGELLARLSGLELKVVDTGLVVLFVALVEIMSCSGFFIAFGHGEALLWRRGSDICGQASAKGDVARFALAATCEAPGMNIEIDGLYGGYRNWCRVLHLAAVEVHEFERQFHTLAGEVGWEVRDGVVAGLRLV